MVIISAGIKPNTELADKLGIKCNKGIPVNDGLETEIKDIYAAGDIAEHRGICYGIWPAAEEQGKIAGVNMAGGSAIYTGTLPSNILKIAGINLISAGDIDPDKNLEAIVQKDSESFIYKKLVIKDNGIVGCILYGNIDVWKKIKKAMDEKKDISRIKTDLEKWDMEAL